jgi:carboxyl-terminal processing protease
LREQIASGPRSVAHWPDAPDAATVEAAHRAYVEAALSREDRAAFTRASMRFMATFPNGHTFFLDRPLATRGGALPFSARFVGERWVVTASGTEALRAGDVLETIDGRPFEEFYRDAMPGMELGATEGRWVDPERLGYIRVPSFFEPGFEKRAVELVREYGKAAALIVDVRGNAGGSTPRELTRALMTRPYRWWTESTPAILPCCVAAAIQ